jgi:hypothetical protein
VLALRRFSLSRIDSPCAKEASNARTQNSRPPNRARISELRNVCLSASAVRTIACSPSRCLKESLIFFRIVQVTGKEPKLLSAAMGLLQLPQEPGIPADFEVPSTRRLAPTNKVLYRAGIAGWRCEPRAAGMRSDVGCLERRAILVRSRSHSTHPASGPTRCAWLAVRKLARGSLA